MSEPDEHVIERIPKLPWGDRDTNTDDLMVVSALRICLDAIAPEVSRRYLAGTTGAAFDIGWARSTLDSGAGGALFAHPHHFERGIDNLCKAIGREYTIAYRTDPDELWRVAAHSIHIGHPVVATEWQTDRFAVLAGYDRPTETFFGRRYADRDQAPDDYVPLPLGDVGYVLTFGKLTDRLEPKDAVLGALRCAVANARADASSESRSQGGTGHRMAYGPAAYAAHASLVPEQLDPELEEYDSREHLLLWRFDVLTLARVHAILYLREVAELFDTPSQDDIEEAVEAYRELLGMINAQGAPGFGSALPTSEAWERIYFGAKNPHLSWDGGRRLETARDIFATLEGRQRFADWLLAMGRAEEKAIAALARVVERETAA